MKRQIHAATNLITKDQIKEDVNNDWPLIIDTPNLIAYADDNDSFTVIELDKVADYLNNDPKADHLINDLCGGSLREALIEAYFGGDDCGVERYSLPDRFGFDRGDVPEIVNVFKKAKVEVPNWLYM